LQKDRSVFILFHTIHDVLRMEKILKKEGVTHELVPVPRNLSSDCGMCVRLDDDIEKIRGYLDSFEIERSFCFDGQQYEKIDL